MQRYDTSTHPQETSGGEPTDGPLSLADTPGDITTKLGVARKDLLDLGLRNPLLNYRLLRARGLEVVDEISEEIFRILVRQGKAMSFLPVPDGQENSVFAQPLDSEADAVAARHTDSRLQTAESSTKLQTRLLATYHAARTAIEEQGVNTLYLALGMLHWREPRETEQERSAPLILVPVELDRANARSRFEVRHNGDDIGPNLSLMEKLKWDFGLSLPPMPDIDDLDVGQYFDAVRDAIDGLSGWQVKPDEIALGFFSFAKLLMFEDLDPERWPENNRPEDHPLLRSLLGECFRDPPSSFSEQDNLDRRVEPGRLHPIMDADSSQTLAILDVQSNRNLVIQGPPGTGKSQTIANMIAEAIAADKKVLFVAEKLAALSVVKRRLDSVGLGDACLELHSRNTQKKTLLQELRRTLELGNPRSTETPGDRAHLDTTRERLNAYCDAMNEQFGSTRISPHDALGQIVRLRQQHDDAFPTQIEIPGVSDWDAETYQKRENLVGDLQSRLRSCGPPALHAFRGSRRRILAPTEDSHVRRALTDADEAVQALAAAARALADRRNVVPPARRAELLALFPQPWQLIRKLFGRDKAQRVVAQNALREHGVAVQALLEVLDLDESIQFGDEVPLVDRSWAEQRQILAGWLAAQSSLAALVGFNQIANECEAEDLGAVVAVARSTHDGVMDLRTALRMSQLSSILERAYAERPALAEFNRDTHESAAAEFRTLDARLQRYHSAELARAHWERLPRHSGGGQLAVLKREFEKKARHMPIRKLMAKSGMAVQAIKPVFMMSPLSIANYIPPGTVQFDLVIFDEASQVRPVDAFGALLRGHQAVVFGDSKQLPPTSFFDSLTGGDDEPDEENATADIESILGLFSAQLAQERMLRWHYRSRHESLITVSNHLFYNDRLIVFPSPDGGREQSGLVYHHLPQGAYDRGRTRSNPIEAEAVTQAVMAHARTRADLTLGVAAFSVSQMQAILDKLEIIRRQDPSCEEFFTSAHPHEPFFIKNLENVQGDERDVIFISVGYGRTADGYLSMSFGPLNSEGGERRLNVLISRARVRCEVFTNLTADDISADGKGAGVFALKTFLKYAQTGVLDVPRETGGEADSPFEDAVFNAISATGLLVHKQVGAGGFRIDLAIVDPDHPGRYVLGIECDGATYHSARSARDRDRLRQQVLENLGWRIYRIWSTDWFRDASKEMTRLTDAIAKATTSIPTPEAPLETATENALTNPIPRGSDPPDQTERSAIPAYTKAEIRVDMQGRELYTVTPQTMAAWVTRIVEIESPVHRAEIARRIVDGAGIQRVGSRIEAAIAAGINEAVRTGRARVSGDFVWKPGTLHPPIRDRSSLSVSSRKLQLVAPEELDAAICRVIEDAVGMRDDEVPPAACRLLGFGRMSDDMRIQTEGRLLACLSSGAIARQNEYLALGG
jgi:very-short-patch-repair endonuclease